MTMIIANDTQKSIFKTYHAQQGTTDLQAQAAKERAATTPTLWTMLCDYAEESGERFAYLLLAAQRKTNAMIDEVAAAWGLDEWEALAALKDSELRLVDDREFTRGFKKFLRGFDLYLEDLGVGTREQAFTVADGYAMTYEEIGEKLGISWQRVQQIEQEALEKIRKDPKLMATLMEVQT